MPIYVVLDNITAGRLRTALILGAFFAALGLPLFLLTFFWKIGYDSLGIYCFSPWREKRFVAWSGIDQLSYSKVMKQWIIRTTTVGTVRINILVPGSKELMLEMAGNKVNVDTEAQCMLRTV